MQEKALVDRFFLYGDAHADAERDFLHVEPIPVRSGAHDWTIHPHAHPEHLQILLVTQGGGSTTIEGQVFPIAPPCAMLIPAGSVHSIDFLPDTDGFVATVAEAYFAAAGGEDAGLAALARRPMVANLKNSEAERLGLGDAFAWLMAEFVWAQPGRRLAVMAQFQRILVAFMRVQSRAEVDASPHGHRDRALVTRYRERIERHFRTEKLVGFYASSLGVTQARLNAACRASAGQSALQLLHHRLIVEAKRSLLYTNHTVADIAHTMGFDDPAYFTRFFSQRVGQAPRDFRRKAGEGSQG